MARSSFRPLPPTPRKRSDRGLFVLLALLIVCVLVFSWKMESDNPNGMQVLHQLAGVVHIPQGNAQAASSSQITAHTGSVLGGPTLTASFVNRVLALANSPARGTGQALYNLSEQYGIDDAAALGVFKVESNYGTTGVARVTKSLGNIQCTDGYTCYQGFRSYASYSQGYEDWYRLIRVQYVNTWHKTTLVQIVPTYAPKSKGNDPSKYIATVEASEAQWWAGRVVA